MKKTSKYANKRRDPLHSFNGAAFINTIQRCGAFNAELIPGAVAGIESAAISAEVRMRDAFAMLSQHERPLDPEMTMDLLSHCLGVSIIRALQIHQDIETNPVMPTLRAANEGLQRAIDRWKASKAWGLDAPGREAIAEAVEIYAEILRNSSSAQMEKATQERLKVLQQIDARWVRGKFVEAAA